jgi:small subunit ribosomal protein S15
MLSRSQAILGRLLSSLEASGSVAAGTAAAARAVCGSAAAARRLRDPLPPTPPPAAAAGPEQPALVDRLLGAALAPRGELERARWAAARAEHARFPGDTGSPEAQVGALTARIASLAAHLGEHRKDHSSRRGLAAMLAQRRALLQYLRRTRFDAYAALISRLGLKDSYGPQDRLSTRYRPAVAAPAPAGGGGMRRTA